MTEREREIEHARAKRRHLITMDQPLRAYEMLKELNYPELAQETEDTYKMVRHMFDYDFYKEYYGNHLPENPVPEEFIFRAQEVFPRFNWVLKKMEEEGAKTMVDIGCADGVLALTAAYRGIPALGVNLYKPSVELATKRATKAGVPAIFTASDVFDVTGTYDAVVAMEIIEHVPDPTKFVKKLTQLCRPTGWIYISTPDGPFGNGEGNRGNWELKGDMDIRGHVRVFTKDSLSQLLDGFEIKEWADLNDGLLHVQARRNR
jgi:2-polyprenyl-3-methyl-5-hydroxy-6-metoxy-1,4-benzoquinol methylase